MPLGRLADYELIEPLGQGGMGLVFKARDSRLDRVVALKILPEALTSSPEHRARFLREARAEAGLNHSAIATCFDVGEAPLDPADLLDPDGTGPHPERVLFLSMEYVPGSDLMALVEGDRQVPVARVIDIAIQIVEGLESAHAAGVVHRDLKPSNVRVTPDGRVKILDFGLARILPTAVGSDARTPSIVTSEGKIIGTAYYMAPEQAHGRPADARSDLFSLGVMLYQLVTGKLPFRGRTHLEVMYAVDNEDPPPLARYASGVPDELERIVRKLIEKRPDQRYQSAHEVLTDLQRLRAELGIAPVSRREMRAGTRVAVVVVAVVAAGAAIWWAWSQWGPHPYRAVAVRPFLNRTGDPRLDYVGEGLAAEVVGDLVRSSGLNVATLSSAASVAGPDRDAQAVARELGVQAVLEGSLRRQGGGSVLDVVLVDGSRGFVLWADRLEYSLGEAVDVEREIAAKVAQRLTGRSRGRATAHLAPRSTSAYALYLRASDYLADADRATADEALRLYDRALELDPEFALAWAGRSRALWKIWSRDRTTESIRLAEEAANRAVRLNPELLEGRLARAQIYRATSRYAESVRELEAILSVNPNWDEAMVHLAATYRESGDLAKAEISLRRAVEVRPGYWRNWNSLGALLIRRGDYPGARAAFQKVIDLVPEKNQGYEQLAAVALLEGNYSAAIDAYEKLPAPVQDGFLASNIGTAYYFESRLPEAERFFRLAVQLEPRYPTWRHNLGDLHARAGRPDSARAEYTEAVRLVEDILHVDPSDVSWRLLRAVCLAKAGDCAGAGAAMQQIGSALPSDDAQLVHDAARVEALCGHRDKALDALKRAVALGFSTRLIKLEDEFHSLAKDPAFVALMAVGKH